MQPEGILETCLYADDLVAAERFYTQILGLRLVRREVTRHLFFRCGDHMLLIFRPDASMRRPLIGDRTPVPPHGAKGPGHVCFRVQATEFPRWIQRLQSHRIRIEADFHWPGGARSLYFRDPAGNSLEFAEPRLWPMD